jgi:hypothetical protein
MKNYILKNKKPVICNNTIRWAVWFSENDRVVKQTQLDNVFISTVFLGIDHNWGEKGKPILFETMIFEGKHNGYQERYCTWEDAELGHERACKMVSVTKYLSVELVEAIENSN